MFGLWGTWAHRHRMPLPPQRLERIPSMHARFRSAIDAGWLITSFSTASRLGPEGSPSWPRTSADAGDGLPRRPEALGRELTLRQNQVEAGIRRPDAIGFAR
jgi:hypothetical protein